MISPLVAPLGIFTLSCVSDASSERRGRRAVDAQTVVPVKFVPVIVTVHPTDPLAGANELVGGAPPRSP